jgi:Na+-transporting NADH:ubiquinone oxidoreductase subunit A
MVGYPLDALLAGQTPGGPVRLVSGGALAGDAVPPGQKGLDAECAGLTVLAEATEPKAFYFVRPGWGRRSYSRCFPSALRPRFAEAMDTSLRGERRACVACGACESVCPAGILPHMIHRHLYRDALDDAARLRVDLCIGCGLCSFVCPSKIELRQQFVEAQERLRQEASAEEVRP